MNFIVNIYFVLGVTYFFLFSLLLLLSLAERPESDQKHLLAPFVYAKNSLYKSCLYQHKNGRCVFFPYGSALSHVSAALTHSKSSEGR